MFGDVENVQHAAYRAGVRAGVAAGSWVVDGNTTVDEARALLVGIDESDDGVMDLCPSPLSGEWGGGSMGELLGDDWTDEDADNYELGFQEGFWDEVTRSAQAVVGSDDGSVAS